MPQKHLTPQDLPAGVTTTAQPLPGGGRVYLFTHNRLGQLGKLILSRAGGGHSRVSFEIAPGSDPDSDKWTEQYQLFHQVATTCLNALPGGAGQTALPSLQEARISVSLYQRFLRCKHSIEMLGLAKQLSPQEYEQLQATIGTTLLTANALDRKAIEQRRGELQFYWDDLQARPEV